MVLNDKHGVITEPRFQKMTTAQWYFHYAEIQKNKKENRKRTDERFSSLCDVIKISGTFSHPKVNIKALSDKIQSDISSRQTNEQVGSAEEFEKFAQKAYEEAPEVITVTYDAEPADNGVKKGKYDRKRGIVIKKQSGD